MARPINADAPEAKSPSGPPAKPRRRRRKPVPMALKGVGALFALAIAFLVAAILGGGGADDEGTQGTAPGPVARSTEASSEQDSGPTVEELGYPAFATSNTTRIGGPDPASNAAGVALAAYPSTDEGQRPAAVVLVDADDWQGAIAAAVLMAEPVGAPVLFIDADGVPEPTAQALDALAPRGGPDSKGAAVFAIGSAPAPDDPETTRVAAADGVATAAAIARLRDRLFGAAPRHIVVAPAAGPEFSMPAAAWAARSGDPVLFTSTGKLPAKTAAVLRRHSKTPVYVLGPSSAISSKVVREIGAIGNRVRRVSGEDPVANAIALARYADGDFGWNVNDPGHGFVVARSDSPLGAAAAAPLSASGTWGPLLLTDSADTLPKALRGYLLDVKPGYTTDPTRAFYNHVWVIGDEDAIEVSQQAEIDELAELAKIGGKP
jgi:Cell wall binding domain 2 (CWB2)